VTFKPGDRVVHLLHHGERGTVVVAGEDTVVGCLVCGGEKDKRMAPCFLCNGAGRAPLSEVRRTLPDGVTLIPARWDSVKGDSELPWVSNALHLAHLSIVDLLSELA